MNNERWLLPEGIEELLPSQARRLEQLRRGLLDLFYSWGYELVIPPLVEFLDSLLTGTGNDLDIQTFKLTDQLSGRLLGVRADITPQVARIDAHRLVGKADPVRLCYAGTVLHTRGDGLGGSRCFTQIGAELYGYHGIESDAEVLSLMLEGLRLAGFPQVYVDLGHVGIFRALCQAAGVTPAQETPLFDALQRKAAAELENLVSELNADARQRQALVDLVWLNGDDEVLQSATQTMQGNTRAMQALDQLKRLAELLRQQDANIQLHYDLAELRGFKYHTGVVFAAYKPGLGSAIAQGGRYDHIGEVFGRARPATGFSADLRQLAILGQGEQVIVPGILAPAENDPLLRDKIKSLRAAGERVVNALSDATVDARALGCNRQLVKKGKQWTVETISG